MLLEGGHNIIFRHGKTTWQELPMEIAEPGSCHFEGIASLHVMVSGAHSSCLPCLVLSCLGLAWLVLPPHLGAVGNCVLFDENTNQFVDFPSGRARQRKLQMLGYDELFLNAKELAALAEGGVSFGDVVRTSPMQRCLEHGKIFAGALGLTAVGEWALHYIEGYVQLNGSSDLGDPNPNPTVITKEDAIARQVKQLRRIAGTPPAQGTNNLFVTHGFNIENALSTFVDEG